MFRELTGRTAWGAPRGGVRATLSLTAVLLTCAWGTSHAHADEPQSVLDSGAANLWSDGRVAVVVAEGLDAAALRSALQEQLDFPIVPLTDSRATVTSRRLLVVVENGRATFSLEDFGSIVRSDSVALPAPVDFDDPSVLASLRAVAVPLLRRASSPLFHRSEVLNPFGSPPSTPHSLDELLDPFGAPPRLAGFVSHDTADWLPTELLNPFEEDVAHGVVPASYLHAPVSAAPVRALGAAALGQPPPSR